MDHVTQVSLIMFVDSFRTRLEMAAEETEGHAVSPRRNDLRNRAAENMANTAYSIRSKFLTKAPQLLIKKGDVVQVPLADVDRTKIDGGDVMVNVSYSKLNVTKQSKRQL